MGNNEEVTPKEVLAQDIMDMYYGEFKEENENFHDIDFFIRLVDDGRAEMLKMEYDRMYQMSRQEGLNRRELIQFSSMWMRPEVIEFKPDDETGYFIAKTEKKVFSFMNDDSNTGIQSLLPVKRNACVFSRTTINQLGLLKHLPKTNAIFWWPEQADCGTVIFATSDCCKKAKLYYIAENDDMLTAGLANLIKERAFDLLRKAEGKVIDTTNDSNPVTVVQTETNKEQVR